jgi:hypothetical protein
MQKSEEINYLNVFINLSPLPLNTPLPLAAA